MSQFLAVNQRGEQLDDVPALGSNPAPGTAWVLVAWLDPAMNDSVGHGCQGAGLGSQLSLFSLIIDIMSTSNLGSHLQNKHVAKTQETASELLVSGPFLTIISKYDIRVEKRMPFSLDSTKYAIQTFCSNDPNEWNQVWRPGFDRPDTSLVRAAFSWTPDSRFRNQAPMPHPTFDHTTLVQHCIFWYPTTYPYDAC